MHAVIALVAIVLLLAAAKQLPPILVIGLASLIAWKLRDQSTRYTDALMAADKAHDPWAAPMRATARLASQNLRNALQQTELLSMFPSRYVKA